GIITSSHALAEDLRAQRPGVPVMVVEDAHETDPKREKQHQSSERLRATCYGTAVTLDAHLPSVLPSLESIPWLDFEYVDGRPASGRHGHRNGVVFHIDPREAWTRQDSWQSFIFSSDVGVVPSRDPLKSPNRIINYMAYGIPVVCSPIDAYRRIV